MTPVLAGLAAAVAVVALVWLIAGGARLIGRTCLTLRARLRRALRRRSSRAQGAESGEREWIYGVRGSRASISASTSAGPAAPEPTAEANSDQVEPDERSAEHAAADVEKDAELRASAIVKEAEEKAVEIVVAAESVRAQLEQEVARERAMAEQRREELASFLSDVLAQVRRAEDEVANVRDLSKARELRGKAAGTD